MRKLVIRVSGCLDFFSFFSLPLFILHLYCITRFEDDASCRSKYQITTLNGEGKIWLFSLKEKNKREKHLHRHTQKYM